MALIQYSDVVRNQFGTPIVGVLVVVHNLDGTVPTLYDDFGVAIADPLVTDSYGAFSFNVSAAQYLNFFFYYGGRLVLKNLNVEIGDVSAGGPSTQYVRQSELRVAISAAGVLQTIVDNLPSNELDPIRILWDTGELVQNGDALYNFIKATLGYTNAQMDALMLASGYGQPALPNNAPVMPQGTAQAIVSQFATNGGNLVGVQRASLLTAAQYRLLSSKAADRFDLRDVNGCDLSGNNDNLASLQAAVNQSVADKTVLHVPDGLIAVSSQIQVPSGFTMQGEGRSKYSPSTRFLFTGTDAGFVCGDGAGSAPNDIEDGFLFRDIVTSRIQPTVPGSGSWTPIDASADFVMNGSADLDLEHVLFLNSTRGVDMLGGGGIGRLNMENCGGQVFRYGVNVELAADTCKFTNVHWWPFWSDTLPVNNYSCANADHFIIKRCDSPQFANVSSIAARTGFLFTTNSYGSATRVVITNASMDYATRNYWFDPSCVGASVWVNNTTTQANNSSGVVANVSATNPRINIEMQGTNNYFAATGADFGGGSGPASWNHGTSCEVHLDGALFVHDYGTISGNTDGCFVTTGDNRTYLGTVPRIDTPGLGKVIDGDGYTSAPIRRTYTPTVTYGGTPSGGSYSATGSYTVQDKRVKVDVDVTIASAPSGTLTDQQITYPYSSEIQSDTGYGSYYANSVAGLAVRAQSGRARVTLAATGAAPVTVGSYRVHFEYLIA